MLCWCKYKNNGNNTKRNWIILLNIINLKRKNTQHYLEWDVFKPKVPLKWTPFFAIAGFFGVHWNEPERVYL